MSAIALAQINGTQTASATYIQTSPGTQVTASNGISINGSVVGYGFTTSPWPTTPTASYSNTSNLKVKLNADGGIQAVAPCVLEIKWSFVGNLTSGASTGVVNYFTIPAVTSSTATVAQTSGATYPLHVQTVTMSTTYPNYPTPLLISRYIMKTGDVVYVAFGQSTVQMSRGILELVTSPLV